MTIVIMYVETSKNDITVFIGHLIMCLMSNLPIIFSIMVSSLIVNVSLCEIKGIMYKLLVNIIQVYSLLSAIFQVFRILKLLEINEDNHPYMLFCFRVQF